MKTMRKTALAALAFSLALLPAVPSSAADPVEAAMKEVDKAVAQTGRVADTTQDFLSDRVEELAQRLDTVLGGDRAHEADTGTYVVVRPGFNKIGAAEEQYTLDVKAQIVLPHTQEKLKIEIDSRQLADRLTGQRDEKAATAPGDAAAPGGLAGGEKFFAGLLAKLFADENWKLTAGAGVQVDVPPDPYVKTVLSYKTMLNADWRLFAEQGGFWYLADGVLARTQVSFTRKVFGDMGLNLSSVALWTRDEDNWDLAQTASLLQPLNADTALAWRVGETWKTQPLFRETQYFADVTGRRRLFSDWLYTEVRTGFSWSREDDFRPTPRMYVWLEAFFGRTGAPGERAPGEAPVKEKMEQQR